MVFVLRPHFFFASPLPPFLQPLTPISPLSLTFRTLGARHARHHTLFLLCWTHTHFAYAVTYVLRTVVITDTVELLYQYLQTKQRTL